VKPEQYHRLLLALDQTLKVFEGADEDMLVEDRKLLRHLEIIRSLVLKAESGHPFPLQTLFPATPTPTAESERWSSAPGIPEDAAAAWSKRIRIMIVDDHEAVRAILRALLTAEPDFDVIAEAKNGREAVELASASQPDLVIMDLNMPLLDGVSATRQLLRLSPETKVVVFSANREPASLRKSAEAGAVGYICKPAARKVLINALRDVLAGKTAFQNLVDYSDISVSRRENKSTAGE
jgi:CheY-like chemotaxis protein